MMGTMRCGGATNFVSDAAAWTDGKAVGLKKTVDKCYDFFATRFNEHGKTS